MEQVGLKKEILEEIRKDPLLSGKVAFILGITTGSLPRLLGNNHAKLTQASVLKILRDHLGISEYSDLLESVQESPQTTAAA